MRKPARFENDVGRFDQRFRCAASLKSNTTFARCESSRVERNFFVAATICEVAVPVAASPCAKPIVCKARQDNTLNSSRSLFFMSAFKQPRIHQSTHGKISL